MFPGVPTGRHLVPKAATGGGSPPLIKLCKTSEKDCLVCSSRASRPSRRVGELQGRHRAGSMSMESALFVAGPHLLTVNRIHFTEKCSRSDIAVRSNARADRNEDRNAAVQIRENPDIRWKPSEASHLSGASERQACCDCLYRYPIPNGRHPPRWPHVGSPPSAGPSGSRTPASSSWYSAGDGEARPRDRP